jgi:hypothetical protein
MMQPGGSTTACSLSVRRGMRYQVILKYKREDQFVKELLDPDDRQKNIDNLHKTANKSKDWARDIIAKKRESIIREFLRSEDASHLTGSRNGTLSTILVLSGKGEDACEDRMFIRRILHLAQGISDPCTEGKLNPPEGIVRHPLIDTDAVALDWGKRTFMVLDEIVLYAPCEMAPGRHGEWLDTPGVGEADEQKLAVTARDLKRADALIALQQETNIKNCKPVSDAIRNSKPLFALLESASSGNLDCRIAILHIQEEKSPAKIKVPDCSGELLTCECCSCTPFKESQEQFGNILQDKYDDICGNIQLEDDALEKAKNSVTILRPYVMYFTSAIMSPKLKMNCLDDTEVYPLLGLVERFLRTNVILQTEHVDKAAEGLLHLLKDLEENLQPVQTVDAGNRNLERLCWEHLSDKLASTTHGLVAKLINILQKDIADDTLEMCVEKLDSYVRNYNKKAFTITRTRMKRIIFDEDYFQGIYNVLKTAFYSELDHLLEYLKGEFIADMLVRTIETAPPQERSEACSTDAQRDRLSTYVSTTIQNSLKKELDSVLGLILHKNLEANAMQVECDSNIWSLLEKGDKPKRLEEVKKLRGQISQSLRKALQTTLSTRFIVASGQQLTAQNALLVRLREKWVPHFLQQCKLSLKDSTSLQTEVHSHRKLIQELSKNLIEFRKVLEVGCTMLKASELSRTKDVEKLEDIGRLCAVDFRKHRLREYCKEQVQKKQQGIHIRPIPPAEECRRKACIDNNSG